MPFVSVMIPCYNSAKTLPMALASVLAQTYIDWECIVVDDGSADNPYAIVEAINDPRIRFHRFEQNRGRAAARQQALDMAQGDYLCMIDADDWIYPWKIDHQIEIMESTPEFAMISSGMAITNAHNQIVAVRTVGNRSAELLAYPRLETVMFPPMAHAPTMMRTCVVKKYQYDADLKVAEDVDFLLRVLLDHGFAITPHLTYAYCEGSTYTLSKVLDGLTSNRRMFNKYRAKNPREVQHELLKLTAREMTYRAAFAMGVQQIMLNRRSRHPTTEQITEFLHARAIVFETSIKYFTGTPYQATFDSLVG